jgi:hypothetical protein
MNPQRIEEFRKKLREGRPVRIVNGQMSVEGAAPGGQPPPPTSPAPPATGPLPPAQGVQVKPHEWGTSAAPDLFYATPAGEARAFAEQALLAREYPGFELDVDEDGTPFAHGFIGPNDVLHGRYHVLLVIPSAYGHGGLPLAFVLEPEIRAGAPHRYQDGSLCLDHSGAFTRKSTLVTFLAWVSVWLVLYEDWTETGKAW